MQDKRHGQAGKGVKALDADIFFSDLNRKILGFSSAFTTTTDGIYQAAAGCTVSRNVTITTSKKIGFIFIAFPFCSTGCSVADVVKRLLVPNG